MYFAPPKTPWNDDFPLYIPTNSMESPMVSCRGAVPPISQHLPRFCFFCFCGCVQIAERADVANEAPSSQEPAALRGCRGTPELPPAMGRGDPFFSKMEMAWLATIVA